MTIFEPLFLICVAVCAISVLRLLYLLSRRRNAKPLAIKLAASVAAYFAALFTVSALTHARVYAPGEPQCFDDWCLAVEGVEQTSGLLKVHLAVISHARRVAQREFGVTLKLVDDRGRVFRPTAEFGSPIDSRVAAGERFETGRVFHPDPDSHKLVLVLEHTGPGFLVIGERESLLEGPDRMLLPAFQKQL